MAYENGAESLMEIMFNLNQLMEHPLRLWPTDIKYIGLAAFVSFIACANYYTDYMKNRDVVYENAHGTASWNTDIREFNHCFLYAPSVLGGKTKTVEGRRVLVKKDFITGRRGFERIWWSLLSETVFKRWALTKAEMKKCRDLAQIYSREIYQSTDGRFTGINLNCMVIGPSGSGKSRAMVLPNILQNFSSIVCTDPSAELVINTGGFLEYMGTKVKVLNLLDMKKSVRYNPLAYIRTEEDIINTVRCLKNNIENKSAGKAGDMDFWSLSTECLMTACIAYMFEVYTDENEFLIDPSTGQELTKITKNGEAIKVKNPYWRGHMNIPNFMNMLRMAKLDKTGQVAYNSLDILFADWEEQHPKSYAVKQYKTFKMAPNKTALNILICAGVVFGTYFDIPSFANLTYRDEMDIDSIGREKTAVFLLLPSGSSTFNFLAAVFYSQLFTILYEQGTENAESKGDGDTSLDIPVRLVLDEMANVGSIPDFDKKLATMRKYSISTISIFQGLSQIKTYFKDDWETALNNCNSMVYLGGNAPSEVSYISGKIGKEDVKTISVSYTRGHSGSTTAAEQRIGKNLISEEEISTMKRDQQLVLIHGQQPFYTKKYNYNEHPNYKYTSGSGHAESKKFSLNKFKSPVDYADMDSLEIVSPADTARYIVPEYRGDIYRYMEKRRNHDSLAIEIMSQDQMNEVQSRYSIRADGSMKIKTDIGGQRKESYKPDRLDEKYKILERFVVN